MAADWRERSRGLEIAAFEGNVGRVQGLDTRGYHGPRREKHVLSGQQLVSHSPSTYGNHWDAMLAAARACEQAGLDSVWLADHFMFPDKEHPQKEVPVFDCFVALGAIAACTSRIRIGELVVGVPYRNPVLLAKMLTTLDVIAHGRTIVGLGAAWHEPEFRAYGWPFPSVRDRMEMLEEAVQIVDLVMTQRPASFSGKHYLLDGAYNDPMPVQKPRPPIMIGGSGENVTLRLVAQYADFATSWAVLTSSATSSTCCASTASVSAGRPMQ